MTTTNVESNEVDELTPSEQPQTVQTVQNEPEKRGGMVAFFEVAKDSAGRWHWVLWSTNGRPLATSAIVNGYDQQSTCTTAIEAVKAAIGGETKVVVAR